MEENYKEENHNTILKQAVRKVLKPEGLLQKGSSRVWIDDNGWFLTVVEFQGSWCDRGSYLNVGMQHLWEDCAFLIPMIGVWEIREPEWAGYKGDAEIFSQKITAMAEIALERVLEYRGLADLQIAKATPLTSCLSAPFWEPWEQLMTAALAGDIPLCRKLEVEFHKSVEKLHYDGDGHEALEEELQQIFLLSDEPQKLHAHIVDKIAAQRAYWRSKPGLKRLAVHPEFG